MAGLPNGELKGVEYVETLNGAPRWATCGSSGGGEAGAGGPTLRPRRLLRLH